MENRYDKYKDSGIAWIGEIPEHWEIVCLKRLSKISTGNQDTQDSTPDGKYPFFVRSPKVEKSNRYTFEGPSILMAGDGVGAGKIFHLADNKFACHQRVYCINQLSKINRIFLFYYLSSLFYNIIDSANSKSTVDSVRLPMLAEFPICIPLDIEQQTIAAYLDQKCGEIDELITLQEEMITKLQSYKQSVITEAVTKGLDKNVPLKDSGIEWIGEIPEHWEVVDLRHLCKKITDGSHFSPQITDEGGFYITVSNVFDDKIHFENAHKISIKDFNTLITNGCQPPIGSVLLTKDGTVGRTAVVTDNNFVVLSSLAILSLKSNILAEYVKYVLDSETLQEQMKLLMAGSALRRITLNKIYTLKMIYATSSFEQQAIADYLDQRCSEIDELISIKQQKIEKLKEYKKSLIFECVTGKRKVS